MLGVRSEITDESGVYIQVAGPAGFGVALIAYNALSLYQKRSKQTSDNQEGKEC